MKSARSEKPTRKKSRQKARAPYPAHLARKRTSTISATQAARTFSDLLNRIRYGGEAFVIERGGEPICEMSPITLPRFTGADLMGLLRSLPKPDAGFWDAVEKATRQETSIPESPWER
jgi:antitoxin (DNA-binding transcriptional repressor) of toxin-antitoxin stability system